MLHHFDVSAGWRTQIAAKLYSRACADPTRRFDDLFNLVASPEILNESFAIVCSGKGARTAGIDGLNIRDIEAGGCDQFIQDIRCQLKTGEYKPAALRQKNIPKGDGRSRCVSIPTIADRVVQGALRIVLTPIFEPLLSNRAFSYRPSVGPLDAVHDVVEMMENRNGTDFYFIEADIAEFFPSIPHDPLLRAVAARVGDKKLGRVLRKIMRAPVFERGKGRVRVECGLSQGGPLSPLLAEIYMNPIDRHFENIDAGIYYCRYADDICMCVAGEKKNADIALDELDAQLQSIGLSLNKKKTHVRHATEGCYFLGLYFQKNDGSCRVELAERSGESLLARLACLVQQYPFDASAPVFCRNLYELIVGWLAYFDIAADAHAIAEQAASRALRAWLTEPKCWSPDEVERLVQGLGCVLNRTLGATSVPL